MFTQTQIDLHNGACALLANIQASIDALQSGDCDLLPKAKVLGACRRRAYTLFDKVDTLRA